LNGRKEIMKYIAQLKKQQKILNELFDKKKIYTKRYRKGGWTGKEVLIHIKDSETVLYDRLRRIIAEEKPLLLFFEQAQWQKNLHYMKQDIALAKNVFMTTRDSFIETVEMHLKKCSKKEGVHSRRGLMNMEQLIEHHLWHVELHINHLKKIK
jgi:hypothetical protein